MKILNLYAGIGGNRKLWGNEHQITAIEHDPEIARVYKMFYPNDEVIVTDAHEYLREHYHEFDFIWSSPPCPTHSRMRLNHKVKVYPDMKLYQEILFLKHFFKGGWVVENVIPYYEPLIEPTVKLQRHCFWSNFEIPPNEAPKITGCNVGKATKEELAKYHNVDLWQGKNHRLLLRNCVHREVAEYILNSFIGDKTLEEFLSGETFKNGLIT
jgi:DNA (cytosine-5)-methyltransferase 1